jgi:prepilin-type N-terminal cleavage/methylation domain-containing protein
MFAHSQDHRQFCGASPAAHEKLHRAAEGRFGLRPYPPTCAGFSLIEMMLSMALILVISGATLSAVSYYQQSFGRTEVQSDMYENVRGVAELATQEVGQAGLVSLPSSTPPTLSAVVTANVAAQTVNVSSTTSMFKGEQLLVDAGVTSEELVTLAADPTGTAINGIFTKSHASGASLNVLGVFPGGVVPPSANTLTCVQPNGATYTTTDGSTCTILNLYGDINADGSLVYIRYTCNPGSLGAPGTLTRSVTTITPGVNTISAAQTLLSTLVANPGGTPCFYYTTNTVGGTTFVTNVGLTLSVQTLTRDPQTQQYLTMTKSFLDLSPRNIGAAFELANAPSTNRLQAAPANVAAY